MQIHHGKHHRAYVTNLNTALAQMQEAQQARDVQKMIQLQGAIRFNGGGHVNHSIFWQNLAPSAETTNGRGLGGVPPAATSALAKMMRDQTRERAGAAAGDVSEAQALSAFKERISAAAVAVQGSGWAWLAYDSAAHSLAVVAAPNQDTIATLPFQGAANFVPLLGIDVWEHAYYLQYTNMRADYVKAIWNVVNWKDVSSRLDAALAAKK